MPSSQRWTPRNTFSPAGDLEENVFEAEFNAEYADGEEDDDFDDGLDFSTPAREIKAVQRDLDTFSVLN
ncbi:hypothetical protein DEU56DRAFT_913006 [Suillus clintonianus]|uniref:uncharacterized protein n=1 Tax=Suillus clintonianus TaxID=1904413 RepID=UPI001B878B83|nr:uncharacterized protein DEU56DRAFT_913006 [Suillus clintonianus]KAG2136426.1 hypothetical protein DEU56DRAFT_913006 [Suillus clintonianus]